MTWANIGRTESGNTAPGDEEERAGDGLRVLPRLLPGLHDDRAEEHPEGDDGDDPAERDDGEHEPVDRERIERHAEQDDADGEGDQGAHRPDRGAGHSPAGHRQQEVRRTDVDVLDHPVALAILEDRPGEPGDAGDDDRPQGAADDDEAAVLAAARTADHLEHHDEDQSGADRLGHRVDEEQQRVGPVRLHRPAEPDRGREAPPGLTRAPGLRPRRVETAQAVDDRRAEACRRGPSAGAPVVGLEAVIASAP